MDELRIDGWEIRVDRAATSAAYKQVANDGSTACTCLYCHNFWAAIEDALPLSARSLLTQLGINHRMPAETCEYGPDAGLVLYGAWWHFVGRVLRDPGTQLSLPVAQSGAAAHAFFYQRSDLAHEALRAAGQLVQIDLTLHLPWVVSEPYPHPS